MAASFDKDIMFQWGSGMGKEFKAKGSNVQLGPGLCLARVPLNGRNFEYAAGEDPFLGYHLIHGAIAGIQSENVIANAKHWVNNNEETNRHGVTEIVDDRTRFEMYYPAFKGAVDAGVGSIMCSYVSAAAPFSSSFEEAQRKRLHRTKSTPARRSTSATRTPGAARTRSPSSAT